MKYLKYYEDRGTETKEKFRYNMQTLTFEEALDYISNHCTEFLNNPTIIYRGIETPSKNRYFISEPVQRFSRDNPNYYTLIMSKSPKWRKYPKRDHSFCCSTISTYYGNNQYLVIPEDGSRWGVAPDHDIWVSFNKKIEEYFQQNYDINTFFSMITKIGRNMKINDTIDSNYISFRNSINEIEVKIKNLSEEKYKKEIDKIEVYRRDTYEKIFNIFRNKSMWRTILDIVSPENGFNLFEYDDMVSYISPLNRKRELWTDSPCLFVHWEDEKKLFSELSKLYNYKY